MMGSDICLLEFYSNLLLEIDPASQADFFFMAEAGALDAKGKIDRSDKAGKQE